MPDVKGEIKEALKAALQAIDAPPETQVEIQPSARLEFGDWSTPVALGLAKILHKSPMDIASQLQAKLAEKPSPLVASWTVTPPGYLNAKLDDTEWATGVLRDAAALDPATPIRSFEQEVAAGKTLVEHTATNPNKAAHVGHLRNACIGDSVVRILRRTGSTVEVNNYIDDTGVQVADVVVAVQDLGLSPEPDEPFDAFCSRAYVEVNRRYATDPALTERRRDVLRKVESRDPEVAPFVKDLTTKIVARHLQTMGRFGITYDLLTWESDILELGFWKRAFESLRDQGAINHVESGKHAGCWVLPWEVSDEENETDDEEAKVLVKSDGVATYTAKDIAYQLWKFGLLGLDFAYKLWDPSDPDGPATTTTDTGNIEKPNFGKAQRVINVIDQRQAYPQQIVKESLSRLGYADAAANSIHLGYGVVALSPAAAEKLGIELEPGKTQYAFAGRKGIEVRADELLDRATDLVSEKATEKEVAPELAAGAIRYYLQKFSLNQTIVFDFEDALRTTGDTGVYVQYAHARSAGILRKVAETDEAPVIPSQLDPSERSLLLKIDYYRQALSEAAAALSPSVLTTYAFELAAAYSDFYEHTPPIVKEVDPAIRNFRRALVLAAKATLADALNTLGMAAPERI